MSATLDCRRCGTPSPRDALFCAECGQEVEGKDASDGRARLRARLARAVGKKYDVSDMLGAGGMGVVFLAKDRKRKRRVAIKVLSPELSADASIVERFGREGRTAAGLKHPGIVPTYEAGDDGGLHYFVMKYVKGRPLDEILREQSPAPIPFVTKVLCEAAAALAHAHAQGVIHRDVKPENIIVDVHGRVQLADFGISKVVRGEVDATTVGKLTQTGGIIGTPHYMAPEHALGHHVDGRADQYALAVVGFRMLAGRVPFDDTTLPAIIHLHINEAAPQLSSLRPDVPPHLAAAIARGMSKAPTNRFASMEEFAAAVAGQMATRPAGGRALKVAALLLLAGVGGGALWVQQKGWPELSLAGVFAPEPAPPPISATIPPVSTTPALGTAQSSAITPPVATPLPIAPTAPPPPEVAPAPQRVRFDVTSSPNAVVFIDGRRIGMTPISDSRLSVGVHELRLERTGYRTRRDTVRVTGSKSIRRAYELRRQPR